MDRLVASLVRRGDQTAEDAGKLVLLAAERSDEQAGFRIRIVFMRIQIKGFEVYADPDPDPGLDFF